MSTSYDPLAEASWSILGSNVTNVLELGSTTPGTFLRIFTNENTFRGHLIGSSNIGQTDNYLYVATQTSSNSARIDMAFRNGNVGIGQVTPTAKLHVTGGNVWMTGSNAFLWGDAGKTVIDTSGMIHRDVIYEDLKTQWINEGSNILFSRGRIGVNKTLPEYELDLVGTIRATDITMSSDARLKKDIQELDVSSCRAFVDTLRPVSFAWAENSNLKPAMGFVAQEILASGGPFTEYLLRRPEYPQARAVEDAMWSVNYMGFIAPMVRLLQDMQQRIDALEKIVQSR